MSVCWIFRVFFLGDVAAGGFGIVFAGFDVSCGLV